MRMHERERGIVADGADIAEMVGQPFELRHQRAQTMRARRRLDTERRLDGMSERDGVGDRAVAGDAPGELRRARDRAPVISDSTPLCT